MGKRIIGQIDEDLSKFENFIHTYKFRIKYIRCLFINAYNHFLSGYTVGQQGLKPQCYNSLRMGLESEWIGIYLDKHIELAMHWAFGTAQEEKIHRKLLRLEKPKGLRPITGGNSLGHILTPLIISVNPLKQLKLPLRIPI